MSQHYNYSITEIEKMAPYELDFYIIMLIRHLEEEAVRLEKAKKGQ